MVDSAMSEGRFIIGDVYAMSDIVMQLQDCATALDLRGYIFDPDAMHRLGNDARYLPSRSRSRWVEIAEVLSRVNREATFEDPMGCSDHQTRMADSKFRRHTRKSKVQTKPSARQLLYVTEVHTRAQPWDKIYATRCERLAPAKWKLCCPEHGLSACVKFL